MVNSSRTIVVLAMAIAVAISVTTVYALVPSNAPTPTLARDSGKALGHIELVLTDANGDVKAYRQTDNLIVNNGIYATSDKLFGTSLVSGEGTFSFVGIGTSTTSPTSGDTNVASQLSNKRTGTVTNVVGTSTGGQIQAFWAAGKLKNGSGTNPISEAGLFDNLQNATGLMYARQTFTAINAGSSDSLTVTWSITFADSDST